MAGKFSTDFLPSRVPPKLSVYLQEYCFCGSGLLVVQGRAGIPVRKTPVGSRCFSPQRPGSLVRKTPVRSRCFSPRQSLPGLTEIRCGPSGRGPILFIGLIGLRPASEEKRPDCPPTRHQFGAVALMATFSFESRKFSAPVVSKYARAPGRHGKLCSRSLLLSTVTP
jgi:hypothetical protein